MTILIVGILGVGVLMFFLFQPDGFDEENMHSSVVRIRLTGDEELDNERAFEKMGIHNKKEREKILQNYTWHYLDDLNEELVCTMQLVETEALNATKPFVDSRDIMEELTGITYIRKDA